MEMKTHVKVHVKVHVKMHVKMEEGESEDASEDRPRAEATLKSRVEAFLPHDARHTRDPERVPRRLLAA
jgi:hypothetical protein